MPTRTPRMHCHSKSQQTFSCATARLAHSYSAGRERMRKESALRFDRLCPCLRLLAVLPHIAVLFRSTHVSSKTCTPRVTLWNIATPSLSLPPPSLPPFVAVSPARLRHVSSTSLLVSAQLSTSQRLGSDRRLVDRYKRKLYYCLVCYTCILKHLVSGGEKW